MKKKYKTAIIGHGIVGKRREFFLNKNRQFKGCEVSKEFYDKIIKLI